MRNLIAGKPASLKYAGNFAMKTNNVCRTFCLCFVLFLTGCGAYEQAQEAARQDQQKQEDYLIQKTEQLESMNHLGGWYVQFRQQNAKSPADLEELLSSVINPTNERTAAAMEVTRRLAGSGEIMIDWNIDLAAWQASGQDLSKYRIAWTAKTEVYNVYIDGTGKVHDVLSADFATVERMTGTPKTARQIAAADTGSRSQTGLDNSSETTPGNPSSETTTPGTVPSPRGAPIPLTPNSAPAQFVAALKSGEQFRIIQAMGLLVGSPAAKPNDEVSQAILGAMKTGNTAVQFNGVMALEKWGTASAALELEALAAKSGNFGLQAQAQRIVPILKGRK